MRQHRHGKVGVVPSCSVRTIIGESTTEGVASVRCGATVGIPSVDPADLGNRSHAFLDGLLVHLCHMFTSPYALFFYFMN